MGFTQSERVNYGSIKMIIELGGGVYLNMVIISMVSIPVSLKCTGFQYDYSGPQFSYKPIVLSNKINNRD